MRKRRRYELAEALAGCAGPGSRFVGLGWSAQHLLLLTATPHMGRDTPYHYLWRLLDPQVFTTGEAFRRSPLEARSRHFIRRTKEEMVGLDGTPLYRRRTCDTFSYALSPGPDGEQALYDATTAYLRHAYDRALAMGVSAAAYAEPELSAQMVEERRAALRAELPERRCRIGVGLDLRAADLAARRTKLAGRPADAGGIETNDKLQAVKAEQRALSSERRHVLARTDAAAERLAPGHVRFLAHALVVPARASGALERYDASVEEIAFRVAAAWEQELGSTVRDVSTPGAARLAGLSDWPGFDLLATPPDGDVRNIEVKGRAGQSAVQLELNEWKQACHLGDRYWLYVVFDCATPDPRLVRVRDPFRRLLAKSRESSAWVVSAQSLIDAAEQTP